MKKWLKLSLGFLFLLPVHLFAQIVINEIDSDTPGTDTMEFIELYDGGTGSTSLNGLVVVLFNGSDDASYKAFDLDGQSTDANGYFVIGDTAVIAADYKLTPFTIQNGADAIALYNGDATDFPNDTPVTTANLIDAIVYDTNEPDTTGLLVLLNSGQAQVNENENSNSANQSLQRIPNGSGGTRNTGSYTALPPTPGAINIAPPPMADIVLTKTAFSNPVFPTDDIIFNFNITNSGPDSATNVVLVDTLSDKVDFVSINPNNGNSTLLNGILTIELGTILANVSIDIALTVSPNDTGVIINRAVVRTKSDDPDTTNNIAKETVTVLDSDLISVIINEIDSDNPGTDTLEFVELFDGGSGNTSLNDLTLVLFNGTDDQSYKAFDLDGFSTNADGYFVLGSAGVPGVDSIIPQSSLQNGADAIVLYFGNAIDFPNDTPIKSAGIIDAVVYGTNDADDPELLVLLNAGQPQVDENGGGSSANHSLQRIPNGSGGKRNTSTYIAIPPTPGKINLAPFQASADTNIIINEIDTELPGADNLEFIELFDGGRGNISLAGLVLVLFNGADDQSYKAFDLDGFATDAFGYFVIGSAGVANVTSVISNASLQNGPDAIALFVGNATDFPNDTPITTSKLIDAIVYGDAIAPDAGLLQLLNPGQPQVDEASAGNKDLHSLQRIPNGAGGKRNTSGYIAISPTPGAENVAPSPVPDKADIWVKISDSPDPVKVDETLEYLVTMTNNGPAKSDNVELKNTLPQNTIFISAVSEQGNCTEINGLVNCNIGDMASGELMIVRIKVRPKLAGIVTNTARVSSYTVDPNTSNNSASESTTVEAGVVPDIVVTPTTLEFGDIIFSDSLTKPISIKNVGADLLEVSAIKLIGLNANEFQVLNFGSPFLLQPNDSNLINIKFLPLSAGEKNAQLQIISNDPDEATTLVQVNGKGVASSDTIPGFTGIIINEIHYNPATSQGPDNQFEFIELFNTADVNIPLAGLSFTEGISHNFETSDTLFAAGFLILTSDSASYPGSIGWNSGSLINSGELLKLTDASGSTVDSVFYGSSAPWPTAPNGDGSSLELIHPSLDNALAGNWQASFVDGGTPGLPNSKSDITAPKILLSTTALNFEEIPIDATSEKTLTISNIGTADLQVTGATIIGTDFSDWQITTAGVPFTIAPAASKNVSLTFQPKSIGEKNAQLILQSNDPDAPEVAVTLTGSGSDTSSFSFEGIIVINEVHYNPSTNQGSDANFEFLELANTIDSAIDLGGISFSTGISHTFQNSAILPANGFLIVAKNAETYPGSIEWDSGNLVNGGEAIELVDKNGSVIDFVAYDSDNPWPTAANGRGSSLELKASLLDNSDPENWQASAAIGGSPGQANSTNSAEPALTVYPATFDFGVKNSEQTDSLKIILINPGAAEIEIKSVRLTQAGQMHLKNLALPFKLPSGGADSLTVQVSPTGIGVSNSTLNIDNLVEIPLKLYINSPPVSPLLLFPRNGEITTVLAWFNATDPDAADSLSYSVEVSEQSDFATLHCAQNVNRDTSVTIYDLAPVGSFSPGTLYYWRVKAADGYGLTSEFSTTGRFKIAAIPTSVTDGFNQTPGDFALFQNYPNPFNPETVIQYNLPEAATVILTVFDIQGREVRKLVANEFKPVGSFSMSWNGRNNAGNLLSSGVYFYRVQFNVQGGHSYSFTRKMVFLK